MATWAVLILLSGLSDGAADSQPVPDLIDRLGSPRYAEREFASHALVSLGREALAPLRSARKGADPEVVNRVEAVIDQIERAQLREPTLVKLEATTQPIGLALRGIEKQTGIAIEVDRGARSNWLDHQVVLKKTETLSFWLSLERLGVEPQWSIERDVQPFTSRTNAVFRVAELRASAPAFVDGPFRFAVRDFRLIPDGNPGSPVFARSIPQPNAGDRLAGELVFELMCEPRLQMRLVGAPRVLEARDQRGQPINARETSMSAVVMGGTSLFNPMLPLALTLEIKDSSTKVGRLRGQVTVEVTSRRIEPTAIALVGPNDPPPPPVWCGEFTFQNCRIMDSRFNVPSVEITVQPDGWTQIMMMARRFRRRDFNEPFSDVVDRVLTNIEIVDDRGRTLGQSRAARTMRMMPDGIHILMQLSTPENAGPPHEVHYFGSVSEVLTLPFKFQDLTLNSRSIR